MRRERGATMTEYLLLVTVIAIALIVMILLFQGALSGNLEDSVDCVTSAIGTGVDDCPGGTSE